MARKCNSRGRNGITSQYGIGLLLLVTQAKYHKIIYDSLDSSSAPTYREDTLTTQKIYSDGQGMNANIFLVSYIFKRIADAIDIVLA